MSKVLENRKSMFEGVKKVLERAKGKLSAIPALAEASERFMSLVDEIDAKSKEAEKAASGKTETKTSAQEELIAAILSVTKCLTAMANNQKDYALKARVDLSYWDLKHLRDTDLSKKADVILDVAKEKLPGAEKFGVNQAKLERLDTKAKGYKQAVGDKEAAPGEKTSATDAVLKLYARASKLLVEEIDPMMEALSEDDAQLSTEYGEVRVIHSVGVRHKPPAPPSQQGPQPPPAA